MELVGHGSLSERLLPTGNDEIDILGRQFNSMVERLDHDNRTIRDLNQNLEEPRPRSNKAVGKARR